MENNDQELLINAGSWRRLADYLLDSIIFGLLLSVLIRPIISVIFARLFLLDYLIELLFIYLYYSLFEILFQKTPGKFITRTRVIRNDGMKPNYKEILLRSIIRFIPFEPFSISPENIEGITNNSLWHDRWSKTRVVIDKKFN
jgi:uncharacterized RDD family membrane protein YckC